MFSAFLYQNGHDNFRIAARRVADEPGVVLELFLFPKLFAGRITDDLRSSRFASDFDSRKPDVARGATFFVDNAVHRGAYFFDGSLRKRHALLTNIGRTLQQVRLYEYTT